MADRLRTLIYNVPICGGFCAPTESKERTFLRHFSNEYTLPGAARFMQLAPCIEFNPCCISYGKVGTRWGERRRRLIFFFAFGMNMLALALTIVAAIGLETSPTMLRRVAWVWAEGAVPGCGTCVTRVYMGLESRLDVVDCSSAAPAAATNCTAMAVERDFVPTRDDGLALQRSTIWRSKAVCQRTSNPTLLHLCESCRDNLLPRSSLILSVVTQFPTLSTNLQRATRFGDVNCQKTMGTFSNLLGFCTSLVALLSFRQNCFSKVPSNWGPEGMYHWHIGAGFRCLAAATFIKLVDFACHVIVPTPVARRSKPKVELKLAAWMALGESAPAVSEGSDGSEASEEEDSKRAGASPKEMEEASNA